MCLISFLPMAFTIYISLTDWNAQHFLSFSFIGLKNYLGILSPSDPLAPVVIPTLIWTIVFAAVTTAVNYLVGLLLAVLVTNRNMKEAGLYRSLLIIPWAVPSLISILAWQGLLNQQYGQIDALLHFLGLPAIPWLLTPFWARFSILMVNLWLSFPYFMTVCVGALQSIPQEQYDAAAIDGAGWSQTFVRITFPNVWRISLPLLIPSFAASFNNFNLIYLLTGGSPPRPTTPFIGYTDILASASYKMALTFNRYDLSATISVILFLIVGAVSLFNMRFTNAFKESD